MKTQITTLAIFMMSLLYGTANLIAQPANDLIEDAIDLGYGPVPYNEADVDFENATNTNDNTPASGCALSQPGVWYKFTATKVGVVAAAMILPDDPVIVFFEGPAEGVTSGMELTYVDQPNNTCAIGSISSIETTIGTTYYMYAKNDVASDILINTDDIFAAPDNDLIENAKTIDEHLFFDYNVHFLMATDTNDGGQSGCPTGIAGAWYKFTAGADGLVDIFITNYEGNDPAAIVYSAANEQATSGSDLTWVDEVTNPCDLGDSASINAVEGTTYYIFTAADYYADVVVDASLVLNTETNELTGFEHYPNPVINNLNIKAKTHISTVKIYNVFGQEVMQKTINDTQGVISMAGLSSGLYLANLTSEGKTTSFKVVKK